MMPIVWKIPYIDLAIPGYGLMMMLGFLVAIYWAAVRAQRSGADPDVVLNCGFIALIAGVVGCRLMYVVHYWDQFGNRGSWVATFFAILDVSKGGLEFYGGFIASVVCVVIYLWRYGYSLRWYFDIIAPSSALGLAFGRVGCLLNGCCFGAPCDLPWAIKFPYGSNAMQEQWATKLPGAELPQELLYFQGDDAGIAIPLSRESLAATDEELAAAEKREADARSEVDRVKTELARATDSNLKKQLAADLEKAENALLAAKAPTGSSMGCGRAKFCGATRAGGGGPAFGDLRHQMERYGKTAAEMRALAHEHSSLAVHPAQVYSTITAGLLAFLLNAVYWRRRRDGQVILTLLLVEPMSRWMLELVRADNPVDTLGAFTISQFLALCMTVLAAVGFFALRFLPARSPRATLWVPPPEEPKGKKGAPAAA